MTQKNHTPPANQSYHTKPSRLNSESKHQEAFFAWLSLKYPQINAVAFAIPNGGKRGKREAYSLQRQGVKAGVPDIFISMARYPYHGLYIEMKRPGGDGVPKGKLSEAQKFRQNILKQFNYKIANCYGVDEAQEFLEDYIKGSQWDV